MQYHYYLLRQSYRVLDRTWNMEYVNVILFMEKKSLEHKNVTRIINFQLI